MKTFFYLALCILLLVFVGIALIYLLAERYFAHPRAERIASIAALVIASIGTLALIMMPRWVDAATAPAPAPVVIPLNAVARRDATPAAFVALVHAVRHADAVQACRRAAAIFAHAPPLPQGTRAFYAFSAMGEGLRIAEPAHLFGPDACLVQIQPPPANLAWPLIPLP